MEYVASVHTKVWSSICLALLETPNMIACLCCWFQSPFQNVCADVQLGRFVCLSVFLAFHSRMFSWTNKAIKGSRYGHVDKRKLASFSTCLSVLAGVGCCRRSFVEQNVVWEIRSCYMSFIWVLLQPGCSLVVVDQMPFSSWNTSSGFVSSERNPVCELRMLLHSANQNMGKIERLASRAHHWCGRKDWGGHTRGWPDIRSIHLLQFGLFWGFLLSYIHTDAQS